MPLNDATRRSAIIQLAAVALSGVARPVRSAAAVTQPPPAPAKFAGAFVNWGPHGREVMLQAWEKWLNQAPSSVVGADYYAQSTWPDFFRLSWVPGFWKKLNPARNLVWSVPLTVKGTALKEVAEGLHDAEFDAAAKAISEAQPTAIIRIGWEMNLQSMAWFAKDQEEDYIKAFRRAVEIFRGHSTEFKFDWCPGWGSQDSAADLSYPGDDVVDYVGLDVYDFRFEGSAAERWDRFYLRAPFGLHWHKEFAAQHGKTMSYPEWGVGNFGDNPFFIQQMYNWLVDNERNIAYAAYFNVDGAWPTQIDNNRFPESQRIFRELFGRKS